MLQITDPALQAMRTMGLTFQTQASIPMSRSPFVLLLALVLCCDAYALNARPNGSASPDTDASAADMAAKQKRRDVLREALKLPVEFVPGNTRQLSAQEKAELRQQLRQQRLEPNK
jgi:hypothetical protein